MTEQIRHLNTAWDVDRTIVLENEKKQDQQKLLLLRFSKHGRDRSKEAAMASQNNGQQPQQDMQMYQHFLETQDIDEKLVKVIPVVRKYCQVYAVDTSKVTEFDALYEFNDVDEPFALMFFWANKQVKVDVGTGNNNKINFSQITEGHLLDVIRKSYKVGNDGKGIVSIGHINYANALRGRGV